MIVLVVLAVMLGTSYARASPEEASAVAQPMIRVQVFSVPNVGAYYIYATYTKIGDLASFEVLIADCQKIKHCLA